MVWNLPSSFRLSWQAFWAAISYCFSWLVGLSFPMRAGLTLIQSGVKSIIQNCRTANVLMWQGGSDCYNCLCENLYSWYFLFCRMSFLTIDRCIPKNSAASFVPAKVRLSFSSLSEVQFTWNMNFAGVGTINIPDLKQNAVHFDARTCEFLNEKSDAHYFCSSSILDWGRSYKGCRFLDRVIKVVRSHSG